VWEAGIKAGRPHLLIWSSWSGLILAFLEELGKRPVIFRNVQMIYFSDENLMEVWESSATN
jgi:hypothetical protein